MHDVRAATDCQRSSRLTACSSAPLAQPVGMTGITVRPLRAEDVPVATELFVGGMTETLDGGVRAQIAPLCACGAAVGAALLSQLAVRALGLKPSSGAGVALALMPIGAAAAVYIAAPRRIASDYITSCLEADMKDPMSHYDAAKKRQFWVAVDDVTGAVVGTVAAEDVSAPGTHGKEDGWVDGDAELRRMSVSPTVRGRGVGKLLFAQVKSFCEEQGFKRIVLTTTNLQADACNRLYPGLGFELVGPKRIAIPMCLLRSICYAPKPHLAYMANFS